MNQKQMDQGWRSNTKFFDGIVPAERTIEQSPRGYREIFGGAD